MRTFLSILLLCKVQNRYDTLSLGHRWLAHWLSKGPGEFERKYQRSVYARYGANDSSGKSETAVEEYVRSPFQSTG